MTQKFDSMHSYPVYDETTGKLLGWKLFYLLETDGLFSPVAHSRFFKHTWLRNSYRSMCRFQTKLMKQQNENNK